MYKYLKKNITHRGKSAIMLKASYDKNRIKKYDNIIYEKNI